MTRPIAYITNPLERHMAEHDPDALAHAMRDPKAAVVLLAGHTPILQAGEPNTGLLPASALDRLPAYREQVLLGMLSGHPVIATLAAPETAELFQGDPAFTVADLRAIAVRGLVPEEELGILSMAKSLLDWHSRHRFCANCGSPSEGVQLPKAIPMKGTLNKASMSGASFNLQFTGTTTP